MSTRRRSLLFRAAVALVALSLLGLASATGAGAAEGDADLPQVATNPANGDVTAVWKRRDATNTGCCDIVQARRRLANGTLGAVFDLSAPGQHADAPQVAVAPDGKATFVWMRSDGSDTDPPTCCTIVQGRARTGEGALGSVFNISTLGVNSGSSGPPQLVVAPDGTVTFVWAEGDPPIIRARTRTAGGTLGSPFTVAPSGDVPDAYAFAPQLGVAPDGAVTFMFGRSVPAPTTLTTFQGRRRLANGTMGGIFTLSDAGQFFGSPQVAVAPNGKATFMWAQSFLIKGRARTADALLSGVFNVSDPAHSAFDGQLATGPDGKVTFVWNNSTDQLIKGRARTGDGGLGGIFPLSVGGSGVGVNKPQVAVAPNDGKATFTWDRNDGSGLGNVTAQGRARLGSVLSNVFDVSLSTGAHSDAQVAVAPDGKATFVWRRNIPGGGGTYIQGRARLSNGTLGGIFDISTHPGLSR